MCIGIPGQIMTTWVDAAGTPMAEVDFSGAAKDVCLMWLPEAGPGDHVIVHLGFAVQLLDPEEAEELLALFSEVEAAADGP